MNRFPLSVLSLLRLLPVARPFSTRSIPESLEGSANANAAARVVWFRDHALRVKDNDALDAAAFGTSGRSTSTVGPTIVPVYLWTADDNGTPVDAVTGGTASDVFVANALDHLNRTLFGRLRLGLVSRGSPGSLEGTSRSDLFAQELARVCKRVGATEVYYAESYDKEFEDALREKLADFGLVSCSFGGGHTLLDYSKEECLPWKEIIEEHPFRSPLIPFVDYLLENLNDNPPPAPRQEPFELEELIATEKTLPEDANEVVTKPIAIDDLLQAVGYTQSRRQWGSSIANAWPASEADSARALETFLDSLPQPSSDPSNNANGQREQKQTHLASLLSPYLARGLLSPRQVYHALLSSKDPTARASFVRRICWRDYTYAVVSLFPDVPSGAPIRDGYYTENENGNENLFGARRKISSKHRLRLLHRWKNGETGFPLVDAGMRQLAAEGWMPQKVRLAASTCLVEGLGCSWEDGMDHFADYLVDYDPAINSNMWMNAGCVGFDPYYVGADYKRRPYWDEKGEYVRKWCPELEDLPDSWEMTTDVHRGTGTFGADCLYQPWLAPDDVLEGAGVVLGETYPERCCDERRERKRFFEDLRNIRAQWPPSMTDERGRDMVRLGRHKDRESIGMFTPKVLLGKPKNRR